MATATHVLLLMFFIWCTVLQTGALGDPDDARSLSGEGSVVSIAMLLSAVGVLVLAIFLFIIEVVVRNAKEYYEAQQRAKWAGCTIEPPTTNWTGDKSYACFLSHYKVEAASDARFMHDMFSKMLRCPVFLDSADLVECAHVTPHTPTMRQPRSLRSGNSHCVCAAVCASFSRMASPIATWCWYLARATCSRAPGACLNASTRRGSAPQCS